MSGHGFWRPLPRLDRYYAVAYFRIALLCLLACLALITVSDLFQKADGFFVFADRGYLYMIWRMAGYYAQFSSLLLFRFLVPLLLLLPAVIVLTGAAQHNEYVVLRASGVSMRRAVMPLLLAALALALLYSGTRDYYLPAMAIGARQTRDALRARRSEQLQQNRADGKGEAPRVQRGDPIQLGLADGKTLQSVAVGSLDLEGTGINFLLEIRDADAFRQYGGAAVVDARKVDDVDQYIARKVRLRFRTDEPAPGDDRLYEWAPVEGARMLRFTYYKREVLPWTEPIPTAMTSAMFMRHALGDLVLRRSELARLEPGDFGITLERHRRNAEPWFNFLVVVLGVTVAMRLALRSRHTSYVQNLLVAMLVAGLFYFFAALLAAIGEAVPGDHWWPVWTPVFVAAPLGLGLWWRLDR